MKVMKHTKTRTFSIAIPDNLVKEIEEIALEKKWSRNQTIKILLSMQVEESLSKNGQSLSTEDPA